MMRTHRFLFLLLLPLAACSSPARHSGKARAVLETDQIRVLSTDAYRVGDDIRVDCVTVESIGGVRLERVEFLVFADANANGVAEDAERVFANTGSPIPPSDVEMRDLSFAAVPRLTARVSVVTDRGSAGPQTWPLTPKESATSD